MRHALLTTILLVGACGRSAPHVLAVRCGHLVDGVSDEVGRDVVVIIRDGQIASVGHDVAIPPGAEVLDLSGYTVLPGLIDMHDHLTDAPSDAVDLKVNFARSLEEEQTRARRQAEATLVAGFTSVRNLGTYIAWTDKTLRDTIDRGDVPGPRMQIVGYYLTIPCGGGDLCVPGVKEADIPSRVRMGVARGAAAFRAKAQAAIAGGADLLKVIASGAVMAFDGVPGKPEMTREEIAAVAAVAHAAGKRLAAHAHGAQSIKDAILAGADTIEHASFIDDEGIALAKARGVALSMDIWNGTWIDTEGARLGWPKEFLDKNRETMEIQRRAFTRAVAAGVIIVYGTDAAVYPHGENARQFAVMVERGMRPMDAIRSATSTAARVMGWADRVGAIATGRFGDLIAVRGDPLADIRVLERVEVVVKGGHVVKRP